VSHERKHKYMHDRDGITIKDYSETKHHACAMALDHTKLTIKINYANLRK
jgi:hypothetical protein